jgi:ABC-2 type transport system permease protein
MGTYGNILVKELKSMIRDPKIIIAMLIVPLIITGIMYAVIISYMHQTVKEVITPGGIVIVIDNDHGYWAKNLTNYLERSKFRIIYSGSLDEAIREYGKLDALGIIIIPDGFSKNISSNMRAYLNIYFVIRSPSIQSISRNSKLLGIIDQYASNVSAYIIRSMGGSPEYVLSPINNRLGVYVKGRVFSAKNLEAITGSIVLTNIFVPIIVIFLAAMIAQLSATSIAVEKEEKMLETLLSLPLNRFSLIFAKITAAVIAGLLGVFIYGAIMLWYFESITSIGASSGGDAGNILAVIGSIYSFSSMGLLVLGLIGVVLFVLGLSVLISLFVEDVRSAQIAVNYVLMPLLILLFIGMFIDMSSLSITSRIVLALIPIANVSFIPSYAFLNDYISMIAAVASSFVYAFIIMYINARIINTEKIFTMKLFRKRGGILKIR